MPSAKRSTRPEDRRIRSLVRGIDPEAYLRLVRGRKPAGPPRRSPGWALRLGSGLYAPGRRGQQHGLRPGWKATHRAAVPVISVGNITLGGTGKTPMVEWIARWYRRRGVRVALISRGYGHAGGINDEGLVLEENLPDVPHLQDPDRVALAEIAVDELESELIVLDDGFQHRRLARDLDLVMLDALDPFGLGRLFPRGLLREPVRSLRRASAVILSRADLIEPDRRRADPPRGRARAGPAPLRRVASRPPGPDRLGRRAIPAGRARRPASRRLLRDRQPRGLPADPRAPLPPASSI